MSLIANDQIGDRGTGRLVVRHLVDPALLQPAGRSNIRLYSRSSTRFPLLYVGTRSRGSGRVHRQCPLCPDEIVVNVAGVQRNLERRRALGARACPRRRSSCPLYSGEPSRARDGRSDQFHMADLFGADALQGSLYGLDVASPRKFMLWNRYCIIVRISPNWPPEAPAVRWQRRDLVGRLRFR